MYGFSDRDGSFFGSCLQVDNLAHWPARSDRPSRQVVANAVSALGEKSFR